MNIIVGATGQIGSCILKELKNAGISSRAVIRDPRKLTDKTIEFRQADLFNSKAVKGAFSGGSTAFLITPEDPQSNDPIEDAERIVENYRSAILENGIRKIIGLSTIGAHLPDNSGNLAMSRILEQGLSDLPIEKIFIRPSYYFSNWLPYLDTVAQYNILPTFFPEDLTIEMNSPADVANLIVQVLLEKVNTGGQEIIELTGPVRYSSSDVSSTLSKILHKEVQVQQIPTENWLETLLTTGFTENAAQNLMAMTQVVVEGRAVPQYPERAIRLSTSMQQYFEEQLNFG